MIQAQKIACKNLAAFDMSFVARTSSSKSPSTRTYPVTQTAVIDLGQTTFRPGDTVWPEVDAVLGRTIDSDDRVVFAMNGQTATYEVKGATLTYSVKLIWRPDGTLPDFPADVPLVRESFTNWAGDLTVPNVWTCDPRTPQDVVDV